MPTVVFPNGNVVSLHAANKCGISTVQSYLGYPFYGDLRGRNGKRPLIESGKWFNREAGKRYTAPPADHRAAVIRDPIKRMTSIYTDRVLRKNRENCKSRITSWEVFVNEFPKWQKEFKDINIHSLLQSDVLLDKNEYEKIFTTNQLSNEVRDWVSSLSGVDIPVAHGKDGRGASEQIIITSKQEDLIREYFKNDYKVFGSYFQ